MGRRGVISVDGASLGNPGPAAFGILLECEGEREVLGGTLGFATNNEAEYKALIAGLERAIEKGITRIIVKLDSELVAKQLSGEYKVRNPSLRELHKRALELLSRFEHFEIEKIPERENKIAHKIAHLALERSAGRAG